MNEPADIRLKRLSIQSARRGMREADLLLERFAGLALREMNAAELDAFESLLDAPDPDILAWLKSARICPPEHAEIVLYIKKMLDLDD